MAYEGKRLRKVREQVTPGVALSLREAVSVVKKCATAKFDETVELVVSLNVDPRKAEQAIRGVYQLPHGTGKVLRVAVFARGAKAEEAQKAGADIVGAEELAEKVMAGSMDFDRCIATPDMMVLVGKLGKVLGPRGLMPNPKLGSVTMDVASAVAAAKGGQIEYRVEKAGLIHSGIGKVSFSEAALEENVRGLVDVLLKIRPAGVKGSYVRKISLSSTMGPGVVVDHAALLAELSAK